MDSDVGILEFLVSDVARLLRRSFECNLTIGCLPLSQARVLVHISRNQGCRQAELAEVLEIQPITLSRLIDRLELAGLVERRKDSNDKRVHLIYLREKAEEQLSKVSRIGTLTTGMALRNFTHDEVCSLMVALQQVRNNLSSSDVS